MTLEDDDLEGLAAEIRRLIESNRQFLERVDDEDFAEDEESEEDPAPELEEEL